MLLPGGHWGNGELTREVSFRPPTGELELTLIEGRTSPQNVPARVTELLGRTLERIGDGPATEQQLWQLAIGDRQFLVRQLAAHFGCDEAWLSADCGACGHTFDFRVRQTEMPVKVAGEGFPFITIETARGVFRARVPTGYDQNAIVGIKDERKATRALAQRLFEAGQEQASEISGEEMEQLSIALEKVAPEVATEAVSFCPQCDAENRVYVDPYLALTPGMISVLDDVHLLASHYHWSEHEILKLSPERRRSYVRRVDRDRGVSD